MNDLPIRRGTQENDRLAKLCKPLEKTISELASANGSAPDETASDLRPLTDYEQATDKLHDAARYFVTEWIKAPRDSSFDAWFKACERLELAAVEYANAKAQND